MGHLGLFKQKVYMKNCWRQWDSNSDRKVEGEHTDHYHGPGLFSVFSNNNSTIFTTNNVQNMRIASAAGIRTYVVLTMSLLPCHKTKFPMITTTDRQHWKSFF